MGQFAYLVFANGQNLGAFVNRDLAVRSVKFSYHKLTGTKFQVEIVDSVTTVTATGIRDGKEFNEPHTITYLPIYDEVTHL